MEEYNKEGCIQVGNIYPDSENMANRSSGRVNSAEGCSPTILSRDFKQPKMIMEEPKIAAMRGRNPDNPSERGKSNGNYQQRLEVNENGTSNTITSVQKDNLVIEPQVMTPKRTEFGKSVRKEYEKGELDISRHAMTELTPRKDGISNTLTSVQKDNLVCEPLFIPEATTKGYAEATDGDSVNLEQPNSKTRRGRVGKQMANTLTTSCNQGVVVSEPKVEPLNPYKDGTCRTIKAQYQQSSRANFARQDGLGATGVVQIGNIYPDTDGFKNRTSGRVNSAEGLSPTLRTVTGGHNEPKVIITDNGNNETKGIYTESNETNTRKILQILREEVGEETYQWTIGRLISIFKAEILQQGVYEEGICKDGETLSRIQPCTSYLAENSLFDTGKGNKVRDMRCDTEYRCASQGFQLSEQFAREFNDIMSQLPHETASTKECMSYMWQTCKGTQLMQQTLHTLEEIWEPTTRTLEYIQSPKYRIRKLTCRECFRLMDVDEDVIDTIQAAGISNSQQYKLAGNSIVVACLEKIFEQMFFPQHTNSRTLFG